MPLSKKICSECFKKHSFYSFNNKDWATKRVVWCLVEHRFISTLLKAPDRCHYILEQTINERQFKTTTE